MSNGYVPDVGEMSEKMSEKTMLPRVGIGKSGYEQLLEDEIRKQLGSIGIEF